MVIITPEIKKKQLNRIRRIVWGAITIVSVSGGRLFF